jgi:hypothetical protein
MTTTEQETPRSIAKAAGYYIREGSYHGTTDDRARQRQRRTGRLVPPIAACHFERDGEVIARLDPAECNRHLGLG